MSTLAGSGSNGVVDGTGTAASFIRPVGITIDAAGNLYITDALANNIRKIVPLANGTGVVTTLAGTGAIGNADGPGTSATFDGLREITIDASGILYIVDILNNKIRKIVTY